MAMIFSTLERGQVKPRLLGTALLADVCRRLRQALPQLFAT